MEENKVSSEIAKLAKEKGFVPCTITTFHTNKYLLGGKNTFINETCMLLWKCELQKWLREIHNIHICVLNHTTVVGDYYESKIDSIPWSFSGAKTYEEALEAVLLEALKTIKRKTYDR